MSIWNHPISWSKLKMALECPRELQFAVDKVPMTDVGSNFYMELGTWVQYVFEMYFNQRVNREPRGRTEEVIVKVTERVLESEKFKTTVVTYPIGKSLDDLKADIRRQVLQGFKLFQDLGLLGKEIRSEVKYSAVFRGMRMFCMMDFLIDEFGMYEVYDGKGHSGKDADPRQVVYYALALTTSGRPVRRAGLLYWNHGLESVDVTPAALWRFGNGDLDRARKTLDVLKVGTKEELPALPEKAKCGRCGWRSRCPVSPYKRPEVLNTAGDEVSFK